MRQTSGKLFAAMLAVCAGLPCLGATRTWTGLGADNSWTNSANWSPSKVPTTSDKAHFPSGDWTVDIPEGVTNEYASIYLDAGVGAVTFTGAGRMTPYAQGVAIVMSEGREFVVDGCDFRLSRNGQTTNGVYRVKSGSLISESDRSLAGSCRVYVEGGRFGVGSTSYLNVTNNAELVISGGLVQVYSYHVYGSDDPNEKGGLIRLTGGVLNNTRNQFLYTTKVYPGGRLETLGGTILWGTGSSEQYSRLSNSTSTGQGETFGMFLPHGVGSSLIVPSSTTSGGAIDFNDAGTFDYAGVGGSIYATNATSASTGNISFHYGTSIAVRGGATVVANALRFMNTAACKYDFDFSRLNLGSGGIRRTVADKKMQTVNFLDGIVFGAWDDYVGTGSEYVKLVPSGPVAYDTLDCFDGTTRRSIGQSNVSLASATEMSVYGGGSVTLTNVTSKQEFRTLAVAAGTVLELAGSAPKMKTITLKLGAGATLKLDLANGGYVDAAAAAEFGEGAKIVVTALPVLEEGKLYPVYFAPTGTTPDLTKIEFAEGVLPEGWTLATMANNAYLTDGKATAYTEEQSGTTRVWSGAGEDGDYFNAANWVNGSVAEHGCIGQFKGLLNTDVSVTNDLTVREFKLFPNCGPFVFSGSPITFQYPKSTTAANYASIRNDGRFAVVVSNRVAAAASLLRIMALGEGSISLMGGPCGGDACSLDFGGDVRLGADWTVSCLQAKCTNADDQSAKTAARTSRLTVLPGATLTVTGQSDDVNAVAGGALAIAKGAAATIGGTQLLFSSNNTHYVDGVLTVNCPLVASARQAFRGDGTLMLAGGVAASETGDVRVEGNLTLVPANWTEAVKLSVKDAVTIAPESDWTFGSAGTFELENHSSVTFATGGHKVILNAPLSTEGTVSLTGAGKFLVGAPGMKLWKLSCADGVTVSVTPEFMAACAGADGYADVLSVRRQDATLAFADNLRVKMRYEAEADSYVYSVKFRPGLMLLVK